MSDKSMPILGFRGLSVTLEGRWMSPYISNYSWKKDVNSAGCDKEFRFHRSPKPKCDCGFYAYHELNDTLNQFRHYSAIFAVIGWGQGTCLHQDRFRSKYMQVIAVLDSFLFNRESLLAAAKYFNVPLLEEEEFMRFANEQGQTQYKDGIPPYPIKRLPLMDYANFDIYKELAKSDEINLKLEEAIYKEAGKIDREVLGQEVQDFLGMWGVRLNKELRRSNLGFLQAQVISAQSNLLREGSKCGSTGLEKVMQDREGAWDMLLSRGGYCRRIYLLYKGVDGQRKSFGELAGRFPLREYEIQDMLKVIEKDKGESLPKFRGQPGEGRKEFFTILAMLVFVGIVEALLMRYTSVTDIFKNIILR